MRDGYSDSEKNSEAREEESRVPTLGKDSS